MIPSGWFALITYVQGVSALRNACQFVVGILEKYLFIEAMLLVVTAIFVWAAFVRKPSGRDSDRHHWRSSKPLVADAAQETKGGKGGFGSGKRRKRRRKERPRNPTLAQTGGLPCIRPDPVEPLPPI